MCYNWGKDIWYLILLIVSVVIVEMKTPELFSMQMAFDESVWHPMGIFLPVMNKGKPAEPKLATICVGNFLQISIHSRELGHPPPPKKRATCQLYMNCIFMIINNLLLTTLTRHGKWKNIADKIILMERFLC